MAFYRMDEGRLVVPEGWEDRSVNALEYPGRESFLKVAVSRHSHRGRTLKAMVDEVAVDMRRRLAGFELMSQDEVLLDAEPAIEMLARFRDGAEAFEQRSLWLIVGAKCLTVGVLWTARTADEGAAVFAKIRATIHRRDREDEGPMLEAAQPFGPEPTGS